MPSIFYDFNYIPFILFVINTQIILYNEEVLLIMSIQLKRGPSTTTSNPILLDGQPYIDQSSNPPKLKIGDGVTHVNSLPYIAASHADTANSANSATTASSCSGNAASATKLATARKIGNADFNGTANITISQIGAAAASHTHAASQVTGLTANRALVSDGNGHPTASSITSTKLGYLANVTSDIQTQLNGKANSSHTHTASQVSGLPSSLKNPYSLTIQVNGSNNVVYDGSSAKSINLTPSLIGALPKNGTAAAATKLATSHKIGGASFNGTADITLDQIGAYPAANIRVGFAAGISGGQRSFKLFSQDQLNDILGTSGVTYGPKNLALFVMNGDFSSSGLVAALTTAWSGGEIYVVNCDVSSNIPQGAHDIVFMAVKFS